MLKFNLHKLKTRIYEKGMTQGNFAKAMDWSLTTCSHKLTGKILLTQSEIFKAIDILDIDAIEIEEYFFEKAQ